VRGGTSPAFLRGEKVWKSIKKAVIGCAGLRAFSAFGSALTLSRALDWSFGDESAAGCLWKEEEGQDLTEYGLVLVLIALICVVSIGVVGQAVSNIFFQRGPKSFDGDNVTYKADTATQGREDSGPFFYLIKFREHFRAIRSKSICICLKAKTVRERRIKRNTALARF
jgi:Flp pilus assembly pilin Flp